MNEIAEDLYEELSEKFELGFGFNPSIHPKDWPSIKEPNPSITFSIEADVEFEDILTEAFLQLSKSKKISYILDWYHQYYYVSDEQKEFSLYDDGDYIINLSQDFSQGTFGHPWEQTLCVFGKELVDLTKDKLKNRVNIKRIHV